MYGDIGAAGVVVIGSGSGSGSGPRPRPRPCWSILRAWTGGVTRSLEVETSCHHRTSVTTRNSDSRCTSVAMLPPPARVRGSARLASRARALPRRTVGAVFYGSVASAVLLSSARACVDLPGYAARLPVPGYTSTEQRMRCACAGSVRGAACSAGAGSAPRARARPPRRRGPPRRFVPVRVPGR